MGNDKITNIVHNYLTPYLIWFLFLDKIDKLSHGLPFLALANEVKKDSPIHDDQEYIDDMMSQLESMAPSAQESTNTQ